MAGQELYYCREQETQHFWFLSGEVYFFSYDISAICRKKFSLPITISKSLLRSLYKIGLAPSHARALSDQQISH